MLSEKIIALRRKNGWSQEELADKLDVSRQAVSKWESAQSTPDVERIVQMAEIFRVSTDYLLREDEARVPAEAAEEMIPAEWDVPEDALPKDEAKQVSLEEAEAFLEINWKSSARIALGVLLCVLSPICLILLGEAADERMMAEAPAITTGLIVLLGMIAAAVGLFVLTGMKSEKYEYLEKEIIRIGVDVCEMVQKRRETFRPAYVRMNVIAACICVLSPVPIFLSMMKDSDLLGAAMVCCTIAMVGVGAYLFVLGGVKWGAMQKLMQEGDYTPFEKRANKLREKIAPVYWIAATAIYLAWSFASGEWDETWILWPVAGVLFIGVSVVCGIIQKNREEKA